MTRAIVQTDTILCGRWRLDGTTVAVAMIREDGNRMGKENTLASYAFMDLTDHEYDAIMAFDWPDLRPVIVGMAHASVFIACVCGEDTPKASSAAQVDVHCVCGRTWEVEVSARLRDPDRGVMVA